MDKPTRQHESSYELNRKIENILRWGTVAEVRHGKPARCRVKSGGLLSNWVPFVAGRAGGTARLWWPPKVGEQCVLLAPGGDLLRAVAIPGIYSDAMPQGSEDDDFCLDWSEQDSMVHTDGQLTIRCERGITLMVQGTTLRITPEGIFASPDIKAPGEGGVSLHDHVHKDVRSGIDNTGGPV
ncbi:phage baseplate assembly protein V [Verminephrobacter aporrectodeae subsp. tuberculatae]|uniref:Phage baseplate assembly protein V n=1 Tax=Verminephrobacter aporrectodeae subsp. tuberculatae TaxID=1110392 RepID=A0ABT3KQF8_9BURK|nr:phage baseplate assembly protein V [Verminephrobacter aporrectodeae subsp. tuberculatae]